MGELEKKAMVISVNFEPMPVGTKNIRLTIHDQSAPVSRFGRPTQTSQGPDASYSKLQYSQPTTIVLSESEFTQLGRPTVSDEITIKLTLNKQ